MEQRTSARDPVRRVLVHLLDLAVLVKAHLTGLSLIGLWSSEIRGYEDDPVQGLRVVLILVAIRLLVSPAALRSRRTFRFLYHGLESPPAAGASTGSAMLAALAIGWSLHWPHAEVTGLGFAGSGIGLVALGLVVGAILGGIAGLVAAALGRILSRFGLLVGPHAPARLAAALALGATVGAAPELDPTTPWVMNTGLSVAVALLVAGNAGLILIVVFGRRGRILPAVAGVGLALFTLVVGHLPSGSVPDSAPRGILLITIDTVRADHLGCYGYERDTSPRLDALAKESTLFERAYAPMPATDPSHVSILTGLLPRTTGVMANGYPIARPDRVVSLAETCRAAGYRTGAITSRAHLNPEDLRLHGFQTYSAPTGKTASTEAAHALGRASRWIERFGGEPFFLWVHVWDPHAPYDPPREPERSMFGPYDGPVPRRGTPGGRPLEEPYSKEEMARAIALYDGEIRYADEHVGRIIDAARARVGRENLLVVVTADHGETLDEHDEDYRYALDHSEFLSPQEVHVPLLVSWPGRIRAGRRVRGPVSVAGVAPGVAEILGDRLHGDVAGFGEVLLGEEEVTPAPPLLLERRIFLEPMRSYLSVPEQGLIEGDRLYVVNRKRGRFIYDFTSRTWKAVDREEWQRLYAVDRLRTLLLTHPRVQVDLDDVPEDRANALRGLGYGR